jgi:hypothetical protein
MHDGIESEAKGAKLLFLSLLKACAAERNRKPA